MVLNTFQTWLVPYVAEYERQHFLPPRSTPVPPAMDSYHGDMDFERFSSALFPEIVVVVQPFGTVERHEAGKYGSWFDVQASAFVQVEGDQDATRALADIYGTAIQGLLTEQGVFGVQSDGVTPIETRSRLWTAYGLAFPDPTVRDIIRATFGGRIFVADLVSDFDGPLQPPLNPYAYPDPIPEANRVEIELLRAAPDAAPGQYTADVTELDGTVVPPVTEYIEELVSWPGNQQVTPPGSEESTAP